MFEYICPDCKTKLKSKKEAEPGQEFQCPACETVFVPRAEVMKFADDDGGKKKKPKAKANAAAPAPASPPPAKSNPFEDEDDTPYAVAKESEEEQQLAAKNKPTFGSIRDRFKRSARGPAAALMVLPSNLLLGQGALTALAGLGMIVNGAWPLIFTDVSPSDEEVSENAFYICLGILSMVWGGLVCFGASHMSTLDSSPGRSSARASACCRCWPASSASSP
jgi:Zn-finger nucleic acid-binding protein